MITPDSIREARAKAALTQAGAAALVYVDARSWRRWEISERQMPRAIFEFFMIKTKQLTID